MNYMVKDTSIKHDGRLYRAGDIISLDDAPETLLPYLEEQEEQENQAAQPKQAKSRKDTSNDNN